VPRELAHDARGDRIAFEELQVRELVFSARHEARLDVAQALAAEESEQHALVLGANHDRGTVGRVEEVAVLHAFLELRSRKHVAAKVRDQLQAPAFQRGDVRFGTRGVGHHSPWRARPGLRHQ